MASVKRAVLLAVLALAVGVPYRAMLLRDATPPVLVRESLRMDVLGCFMLLKARGQRADSAFIGAPQAVRLDSARGDTGSTGAAAAWRNAYALDSLGRVVARSHVPHSWVADSLTDTIRISFLGSLGGVAFEFAMPPGVRDTVHGRATFYGDAGPPFEHPLGPARAVRVTCTAPDSVARAG